MIFNASWNYIRLVLAISIRKVQRMRKYVLSSRFQCSFVTGTSFVHMCTRVKSRRVGHKIFDYDTRKEVRNSKLSVHKRLCICIKAPRGWRRFFDKASQKNQEKKEEEKVKEEEDDDEEQRSERGKWWEHIAWEVYDLWACALWDANKAVDDLRWSTFSKEPLFRPLETS